ncbi:MAG: hypothetical protein ACSLFP_05695 [Acidimicrobiales bacterium]
MARPSSEPMWAGLGISVGGGLGMTVGLLGWGGAGIALGATFGACIGLLIGAIADSLRAT